MDKVKELSNSEYNTRDYSVFGLRPLSGILKNTTFRRLDLYPSSVEGVGDICRDGSFGKSCSQSMDSLRLALSKGTNLYGPMPIT
jgi:hypothetical protein